MTAQLALRWAAGAFAPGTRVRCAYRGPSHVGVVLAYDDPRVWANSLAFPVSEPDQAAVTAHVQRCFDQGLFSDGKQPVAWDFEGKVYIYWDGSLTTDEVGRDYVRRTR